MKIGVFGTLPPLTERLSSVSSGMLILLSKSPDIDGITFYGQDGSFIPGAAEAGKVQLKRSWSIGSPMSIIRTLVQMLRDRESEAYFFNASLTMFGPDKLSNVIGLLVPSLLAKLTQKKVVVYMHDFIETEEPAKLGYNVNVVSKVTASLLEKLLIDSTLVIVPRPSQKYILEKKYRKPVTSLVVPFVEGLNGVPGNGRISGKTAKKADSVRMLLFGKWGPQKDLNGALNIISRLMRTDARIKVTVAGGINPNFPEYKEVMQNALREFPGDRIEYRPEVPDEQVPELFQEADILFLPYFASGGYSGVMNLGALYNLKIVAYDVKELRESDSLINAGTLFIDPKDAHAVQHLERIINEVSLSREKRQNNLEKKTTQANEVFQGVVRILTNTYAKSGIRLQQSRPTIEHK